MNDEQLAKCLAELGNITRLRIFKLLIKAGKKGLPVGAIQKSLDIPASTLSHHLSKLLSQNLIHKNRAGTIQNCIANYDILDTVVDELKEKCCSGV
ncbi:MAG: helix-turn-helix transcriptional regulator [Epsilonproteobacteria bacterium]|nr:helix-turn-helix transcriptional regulator [Campylobacterota bacterium]